MLIKEEVLRIEITCYPFKRLKLVNKVRFSDKNYLPLYGGPIDRHVLQVKISKEKDLK